MLIMLEVKNKLQTYLQSHCRNHALNCYFVFACAWVQGSILGRVSKLKKRKHEPSSGYFLKRLIFIGLFAELFYGLSYRE